MIVLFLALGVARAQLTECTGYVNLPQKNIVSLKDVKVQLFIDGQTKPVTQSDVASNNGFFYVSHDKMGKVLVKLAYPTGWVFDRDEIEIDVDGATDLCSTNQDLTFTFRGLVYSGTIAPPESAVGPAGIDIVLTSSNGEEFRAVTGVGGKFASPAPLLPGSYKVSASHPEFSISDPVQLELGDDTTLTTLPHITGYQISGRIEENSQPVQGVTFMLKKSVGGELLESVLSDSAGKFMFERVAAGSYEVTPEYKTDSTKFTVSPAMQPITVSIESNTLNHVFTVTGLTVTGRVQLVGGDPIGEARIILDGVGAAISGADGSFELEGVKPGSHSVKVEKATLKFATETFEITSDSPVLPPLSPTHLSLCARAEHPAAQIELRAPSGGVIETSAGQSECFLVAPGAYELKAVAQGVHFNPAVHPISVVDRSLDGFVFKVFTRPFHAFVKCLSDKCDGFSATLKLGSSLVALKVNAAAEESPNLRRISHDSLSPGAYELTVKNENWCFGQSGSVIHTASQLEIVIPPESEPMPPTPIIEQKDFLIKIKAQHQTEIEMALEGEESVGVGAASVTAMAGLNKYCVPKSGVYHVRPRSCHVFDHEVYTHDTNKPSQIELNAKLHRQTIGIKVDEPLVKRSDISLNVNSKVMKSNVGSGFENGVLRFVLEVEEGETLNVKPESNQLYINPTSVSTKAAFGSDGCLVDIRFEALEGLFVQGQIRPAVEFVQITVTSKNDSGLHQKTSSNADGEFSMGPLNPHQEYIVTPTHQNYRFVRTEAKGKFNYEAQQLANLRVSVKDENSGEPVSEVRIILSGPNRYRSILTIGKSGVDFPRLEPGEYFIIFEKKEYKFAPNKIELNLTGNEHLVVVANRYQFSAFGKLASLSGTNFGDYKVEATGKGESCLDEKMATTTDEEGKFKILGLSQDCRYEIGVQPSGDYLISPDSVEVNIGNTDVNDIEFTAFKVISDTRISGNVALCDTCSLKGMSVQLFSFTDDGNRNKIEGISLSEESGTFFNFEKTIKKNAQKIEIEFSAAEHVESRVLIADSPHKHVTFDFELVEKTLEPSDKTHGQLGAALLILILIVSLLLTQGEKIQKTFLTRSVGGNGDGIERGTAKGGRKQDSGRRNR